MRVIQETSSHSAFTLSDRIAIPPRTGRGLRVTDALSFQALCCSPTGPVPPAGAQKPAQISLCVGIYEYSARAVPCDLISEPKQSLPIRPFSLLSDHSVNRTWFLSEQHRYLIFFMSSEASKAAGPPCPSFQGAVKAFPLTLVSAAVSLADVTPGASV